MALGESTPRSVNAIIGALRSRTNTTSGPLGAAGVFTGQWEYAAPYAIVVIMVSSDQDSAVDGLEFQWSGDGNTMHFKEVTSLFGGTARSFTFTRRGDFFRIKYTNGATPQTTFNICTSYSVAGTGIITRALDKNLTEENFAQTVRAIVNRKELDGTFSNVGLNEPLPVTETGGDSAAVTRVATSTASVMLLDANPSRVQAIIVNEGAVNLYVKYGTTASATDYSYVLGNGGVLEVDKYRGRIDGLLAAGTNNAQVTEVTS